MAAAIAADWLKDPDAAGSWEAEYRPFAVDGDHAVAVGETRYPQEGKRYANVYLLEFAADGRCSSFTEWFFLNGRARARKLGRQPSRRGAVSGFSRMPGSRL